MSWKYPTHIFLRLYMKFYSTRGKGIYNSGAEAIVKGLADDGGLCVPEYFPNIKDKIKDLLDMEYYERASYILSQYLPEYDYKGLKNACKNLMIMIPHPLLKLTIKSLFLNYFTGRLLRLKILR